MPSDSDRPAPYLTLTKVNGGGVRIGVNLDRGHGTELEWAPGPQMFLNGDCSEEAAVVSAVAELIDAQADLIEALDEAMGTTTFNVTVKVRDSDPYDVIEDVHDRVLGASGVVEVTEKEA